MALFEILSAGALLAGFPGEVEAQQIIETPAIEIMEANSLAVLPEEIAIVGLSDKGVIQKNRHQKPVNPSTFRL